MMVSYCYWYTI